MYRDHPLKSATNKLLLNSFFRAETLESGVFRGTLGGRLKSLFDELEWDIRQSSRNEWQNHVFLDRFFLCGFRGFKLPESIWNRFRLNLLDQEMNLEKKSSKNIYFFMKKFWSEKK